MTEKELIFKLQTLKQIKPRNSWVSSVRANILSSGVVLEREVVKPAYRWSLSTIAGIFYQRKMAYAFAALLFIFAGVVGVVSYQMPRKAAQVAVNSPADPVVDTVLESAVKSNVEDFKIKSQNLADMAKSGSQNSDVALKEVKAAAANLANELQKNPELAKVIALDINNNKTLLDVSGGNNAGEVVDMYEAIVAPLINDLKERTLTSDQEAELQRIETYFDNGGDAFTALRDILLMNVSKDSRTN